MIISKGNLKNMVMKMGTQAILSFLTYSIINAFTPGPGNILALNTMSNYGWKKGKHLFLGIIVGYYCVQAICAIFIFGLNQWLNPVMNILKFIGAVYIVWLAIHIARSKPSETAEKKEISFWIGFLLQFVNVKIYLFGITALTGYVIPYYTSVEIVLFFSIAIASIGTVASLTWGAFGAILQKVYLRHFKIINIIMALVLLESALSMAFK